MEPLSPELVDELLSAELDGAFDAAAREHGYAPSIARELLDGTPGVADATRRARGRARRDRRSPRSRRLTATRSSPARSEPRRVDDLAAARAARRPRLAKYIAVAAALLVVVGLGVAVANVSNGGGGDDSSSASGAASVTTSASKRCGVRRHRTRRVRIGTRPRSHRSRCRAASARSTARTRCGNASRPSSGARRARAHSSSENGATADSAPPAACVTKQAQALGVDPALVLDGSIEYAGTPARGLRVPPGQRRVRSSSSPTPATPAACSCPNSCTKGRDRARHVRSVLGERDSDR